MKQLTPLSVKRIILIRGMSIILIKNTPIREAEKEIYKLDRAPKIKRRYRN